MTFNTSNNSLETQNFQPRYCQIKQAARVQYEANGVDALVVRNRISALSAYMKWGRLTDDSAVGREFECDFDSNLGRWAEDMRREGKADRTITDRCDMLVKWQEIVSRLCSSDTLPTEFADALAEAMVRRGFSNNGLARTIPDIGSAAIGDWASGRRRPSRNVPEQITKLEVALQLPDGTLKKRLGYVINRSQVSKAAKENRNSTTKYGKRLSAQYSSEAKLHYLKDPHQNVRKEWAMLTAHKVSDDREHASDRDTWRVKAPEKTGDKYNWAAIHEGKFVPAADAAWGFISRYLAWLCLDTEHGGAGFAQERISTLAWIANDTQMKRFLVWMQKRSDGIVHAGMVQTLNYARMLIRPDTGWIWLNADLTRAFAAQDLPIDVEIETVSRTRLSALWQEECRRVHEVYGKSTRSYENSKSFGLARNPKEPVQDIIAADRPLRMLMDMLGVLKKNPPAPNSFKRRAVWLRDVLLFSWLIANPLRVGHFATMTYKPDQSGNLYKRGAVWHYRCESADFKNTPGDYDVSLPKFVGEAVEAYLVDGRLYLAGSDRGGYVFLPEMRGAFTTTDHTGTEIPERVGMWSGEGISSRVRLITRGLRQDAPGFGPHALRHLVAIDYLRCNPGSYKMVAHLLNDKLETVLKVYGNNDPQDGLSRHYDAAELELNRAMGTKLKPRSDAPGSAPAGDANS